jgi:hypothetical protein
MGPVEVRASGQRHCDGKETCTPECWHEPQEAANIEALYINCSCRFELDAEEPCEKESAEDEKEQDSVPAAHLQAAVIENHQYSREQSKGIQAWKALREAQRSGGGSLYLSISQ